MIRLHRSGGDGTLLARLAATSFSTLLLAPLAGASPQDAPAQAVHIDSIAERILDGDTPGLREDLQLWIEALDPGATSNDTTELEASLALTAMSVGEPFEGAFGVWFDGVEAPAEAHSLRARLAWLRGDIAALLPLSAWEVAGPFDNERGRGMRRRTPAEKKPVGGPYEGKGAADDVRWRRVPAPGPTGVLAVAELFHTRDQLCFVARTWLRSAEPRTVVLLLGASEQVRVWHQGDHIYDAIDAHAFGFDGHAVLLELDAGWNEVAMKVGGEDEAPAFVARLVDPVSAAPLALEASATAPVDVEPKELRTPTRRSGEAGRTVPPGPRAALREPQGPRDVLMRALLDSRAEAGARKQRPGFDDARDAHAGLPKSAAAALAHLLTVRVVGALDIEEDVNPWLDVLRGALEVHGDRYALLRDYAFHAVDSQGRSDRALELAGRVLARTPDSVPGRALRIALLEQHGQSRVAEFEARQLCADPDLEAYPGHALDAALWLDAVEPDRRRVMDAARRAGSPAPGELERAAEASRSDEGFERILMEEYESSVAANPYDIRARLAVSRTLLARGDARRALAYLDEAASLAPNRSDVNAWRARALALLGDDAAAVEALEVVLRFDPSANDEARLADFLRSRAGSADPAAAASFEDRYREPLEGIVARAGAPAEGVPREVLHRMLVVEAGADGTARRYSRTVERIVTPIGARELDRVPFRAYPGAEEVRVLSARVHKPDGRVVDGRTGRTGGRGVFVLDMPPLEVGDVVEIEWRRDDLQPSIFGDYIGIDAPLRDDPRLPVAESTVVLLEPEGVQLATHMTAAPEGVERATADLPDGTRETRWTLRGVQPRRREHLEPPSDEIEPRVQASTYASWEAFGDWWWNLISEEIDTSDEMRAKVAELTADAASPLDKLRAVYDFVVTDVRYNAWEFGVHGYQPYSAPVIFSRRFGDCKDKAILMKAMLAEVGIEAWPVVINSEGRRYEEDLSLAMVGHFNHCIAYVPEQEGIPEMFLDGTARYHPLEVLPDSDRGAQVVVVKDDGVDVRRIPFPAASENVMVDETLVDMTGEGAPRVELTQRPTGRWDPMLRSAFGGDETARADAVERTLTRRFGALVGTPTAEHPDYENLDLGFEVKMSARIEQVGRPSDGGLELPVSLVPDEMLARVAKETERATDLLIGMPWVAARRTVYRLPKASRVFDLPGAVELGNEDMAYSRTVSVVTVEDALEIVVEERMEQLTHRIPSTRYDAFRDAARQIDRAQDETLEVEVIR